MFGVELNLQDWVNRYLYSNKIDDIEYICL